MQFPYSFLRVQNWYFIILPSYISHQLLSAIQDFIWRNNVFYRIESLASWTYWTNRSVWMVDWSLSSSAATESPKNLVIPTSFNWIPPVTAVLYQMFYPLSPIYSGYLHSHSGCQQLDSLLDNQHGLSTPPIYSVPDML